MFVSCTYVFMVHSTTLSAAQATDVEVTQPKCIINWKGRGRKQGREIIWDTIPQFTWKERRITKHSSQNNFGPKF
jgi:hypothetical protein